MVNSTSKRRRRHCFQTGFSSAGLCFGPSATVAAEVREAMGAPLETTTFLNLIFPLPDPSSDPDVRYRRVGAPGVDDLLNTSSRLPQIIIGTNILVAVIFHIKLMQGVCKHLILIGCLHESRNCLVLLKFDPVIGRIVHEHVQGRSCELYRAFGHAEGVMLLRPKPARQDLRRSVV